MPSDPAIDHLATGSTSNIWTIGAIFAGESLLRAMNVSVIPIQAYDLLGSSQRVSIVATCVSFSVLMTVLSLPYIFRGTRRRWVYSIGIALVMTAACLFAANFVAGQVMATYLRNAGASIMSITLALYIMENVSKTEFTRSEPVRMTVSTISWVIGPALGSWLYAHYGVIAPQIAVVAAGLLLLAGFWSVRLKEPAILPAGTVEGFRPLENVFLFFRQPRLRLAWSIAFGRSCYWSAIFIYGPLLVIEGGLSKTTAGLLISASQLTLPLALIHGKLARSYSVRVVVTGCFWGMAASGIIAGLFGTTYVWSAVVCLLLGAVCASGLDGVGGIPFYRAVKPRQRQRMTSVYRTFFESSELLPGFLFMFLLLYFETGIVFIVIGVLSAFLAVLNWKYLPKTM